MSSINKFDGILYINLKNRKDRLESIENELIRIGANFSSSKIFRIDAILDKKNGHRGCVLSHLKAVNFAIEKKWKNVLILEDDAIFIKDRLFISSYIDDFFQNFKNQFISFNFCL